MDFQGSLQGVFKRVFEELNKIFSEFISATLHYTFEVENHASVVKQNHY